MNGNMQVNHLGLQTRILGTMKKRYALALGLLLVAAIATFWMEKNTDSLRSSDYELINISGRQRMLSQRLALVSVSDPAFFRDDFDRKEEINTLIDEMQTGLLKILKSRFLIDHPAISKFYYGPKGVKESTDQLISLAKKNSGSLNAKIVELAYYKLLPLLDEATLNLQIRSEEDFLVRERFVLLAFFLTLTILLLEVFFIFLPLLKEVQKGLSEVESIHTKAISQSRLTAMGELTAIVGHELSNSIAISKPTLNTLIEKWQTSNPEKIDLYLSRLAKQTERMERILSALKIQARDANHDPVVDVDIKQVIQETTHLLHERFKSNDIELQLILDQRDFIVKAKVGELYQVVSNLITNSLDSVTLNRKNTTTNWIRIELGYSEKLASKYFMRFSDSGPGVDPALNEKIFEPFFTTKGEHGGTGLGLAVSRRIVEGLGGQISIHSTESQSWFEVLLPGFNTIENVVEETQSVSSK